ncbi:MAG: (d)CMP kinase [Kordiimonadaceae bacterium]|nr:(d)CMP kinase [Kordiimonadaceae bacterium]
MIIAIDGPAAAGKGTLARRLAEKFDYAYLDTGALYRAVGLSLLNAGKSPTDEAAAIAASCDLDPSLFSDPALRAEATGSAASQIASIPAVRSNLLKYQVNFSNSPPENKAGAVLDGRDIGTVVCPNADRKLFITASAEERARRRTAEIEARGDAANFAAILTDVKARDARDMNRKDSPLKPAEDALLLDTTILDIDAVFLRAVEFVKAAMP